ncbi:MAG: transketolase [Anaerolineaceae bacterium]|nr:transketolase [Anaerolineaceae bacterium]
MQILKENEIIKLAEIAKNLRMDSLNMIHKRQAGHPGGSLSAADIMAVLYFKVLNIDPANPNWDERDRFILSKGHASALLYAALARRGFFPFEDLQNWGNLDCHLQGHPDRMKTPGVDMNSGILGHGIPVGIGLALAARLKGLSYRTYALLGDGECQAGIVWEGAATAAKFRLSNLTAIVDYNDVQLDGAVHNIMPYDPFVGKWQKFGWHAVEINGHDIRQIFDALMLAREVHEAPTVIIARTTKGKGVSFMENDAAWHGNAPDAQQLLLSLAELDPKE